MAGGKNVQSNWVGGDLQFLDQAGNVLFTMTKGGLLPRRSVTNITTVGAGTYTAAQLLTGIITRDPSGAARTDTTDTALALISGLGLAADGDIFECILINTADAAEAITLAGGTDVTVNNAGQTLAQNESALLVFRRASATTVTLYIVGA